jgi:hypothetical protein
MLDIPHSTSITRLLDDVMVVEERPDDELVNTKRKRAMDNIRS